MSDINPRIDIAFKKLFGVEENKDLLIALINSIVGPEDQVSDVILLNPYNPQNFKEEKLSILDIKATSLDGKRFNIEIQISDEADYDKRALYYWAKIYTEQLKTSEDYSNLSKAIGIHILNFTSIPESKEYHNVFHIAEKNTGLVYFKDLELHTLELKKFSSNSSDNLSDIVKKITKSLDIWLAFLTRNELLIADNLPKELDDKHLKKALKVLEIMNFSNQERDIYEDHLKWLRIEANTLKKAEEKGIEKGLAKGLEEGIQKGKAEGQLESKLEIAKNLIAKGFDEKTILEITGLSLQEIKQYFN